MSRKINRQLDEILKIIESFPTGASSRDIEQALGSDLNRRTLQRRLRDLHEDGRIDAKGPQTIRRYYPKARSYATGSPESTAVAEASEEYVQVSESAEALRRYIRKPLSDRSFVTYRREFLEAYHSNKTFYLSEDERKELAAIGTLPGDELTPGTYSRNIHHRLLIDLSWNSSRLEGNTYSLLDTERLIELGKEADGKDATETRMILNHKAAIEALVDEPNEIDMNKYTVLNLHALLSDGLLSNPADCGRLRAAPVQISGTVYVPIAIPQIIEECFEQLLSKAGAIEDPYEQAFFTMVHIPYLQPFMDGNKRVSRLAANIPLSKRGLCPLSFVDVPQKAYVDGTLAVYELNKVELLRDVFIWAYKRSCERYTVVRQSLGKADPFRLKYRTEIYEAVAEIVRESMSSIQTNAYLKDRLERVAEADRSRLSRVILQELQCLHEGNLMRYRLRPSELESWKKTQER